MSLLVWYAPRMSERALITEEQLQDAIRAQAAEMPDFRYTTDSGSMTCYYYADDNNPRGCIVGAALVSLGVPTAILPDLVGWAGHLTNRRFLADLLTEEAITSQWVQVVQWAQDRGKTWGEAVAAAEDPDSEQWAVIRERALHFSEVPA